MRECLRTLYPVVSLAGDVTHGVSSSGMEQNCAQGGPDVDPRSVDVDPAITRTRAFHAKAVLCSAQSYSPNFKPSVPAPRPAAFKTDFASMLHNCNENGACLQNESRNTTFFQRATSGVSPKKPSASNFGSNASIVDDVPVRPCPVKKRKRKLELANVSWDVAVDIPEPVNQTGFSDSRQTVTEMLEDWIPEDRLNSYFIICNSAAIFLFSRKARYVGGKSQKNILPAHAS